MNATMSAFLLPHSKARLQYQNLPDQRFTIGGELHFTDVPVEHSMPPLIEVVVQETGQQARIVADISYRLLGLSRLCYAYQLKGEQVAKEKEQETHYTCVVSLQAVRGEHKVIETHLINLPATELYQTSEYDLYSSQSLPMSASAPAQPLDSWLVVCGRFVSEHPLLVVTVLEMGQQAHMLLDISYETPKLPFPYKAGTARSTQLTTYTLILKMLGIEYAQKKFLIPQVSQPQEQHFRFDICYSDQAEVLEKVWEFVPTR